MSNHLKGGYRLVFGEAGTLIVEPIIEDQMLPSALIPKSNL